MIIYDPIKDACVLHNILSSDGVVGSSDIGVNGAWVGSSSYEANKWGNGAYNNSTTNRIEFNAFPSSDVNDWDRFMAEFYLKTDYNVVNGVPSDAANHGFFAYYQDTNNRLRWVIDTVYNIDLGAKIGGVWYNHRNISPSWSAGDLIHFLVVVDDDGIDGGPDKFRVYINGSLEYNSVNNYATWSTTQSIDLLIQTTVGPAYVTPFSGSMNNLKLYNDPTLYQDALDNRIRQYWPGVIQTDSVPVQPQVLLLADEIDLYARGEINKILKLTEFKTLQKDKFIINDIKIDVNNRGNDHSVDHSDSILSGSRFLWKPFKIKDKNRELIWDGIIKNIRRDHNKEITTYFSEDKLKKFQTRKISYESSSWETPADAAKNILDNLSFTDYNEKSFQKSIAKYTDEGCFIQCHFSKDDDVNLQGALDKLSLYGCADVYTHKNKIYFKHWQPFTGGVKVLLELRDLRKLPVIDYALNDIINEYRISYDGSEDTPATDSGNNNIGNISRQDDYFGEVELEELPGGAGEEIVFQDLTSAVYIGECYIRRSHYNLSTQPRPLQIIRFSLPVFHEDWIDLQTFFRLTFDREEWSQKLFEIFKTTIDYTKNNIDLMAYEVDENA